MARLKVPSLQHLARNWHKNPLVIKRRLVRLVQSPPNFSYNALFGAVQDLLLFHHPYEQVIEGMRRGIRRPGVRENLLGVLPLIRDHFDDVAPNYYQSVARRYYSAGRGLMVPFDPPLIYGVKGRIHFPWFSFWRHNPLEKERLSLFVTVVEDVLLQDPDLENAKFLILDFSAPGPKLPRQLEVVDAASIPRLSKEDIAGMLSIFAEGYRLAQVELAAKAKTTDTARGDEASQGDEPDLFDEDK